MLTNKKDNLARSRRSLRLTLVARTLAALALVASALTTTVADAQAIYSPVILFSRQDMTGQSPYPTYPMQVRPDGTGAALLPVLDGRPYYADLSRVQFGANARRYFVNGRNGSTSYSSQLVCWDENGSAYQVLTPADSGLGINPATLNGTKRPQWSPDGTQVLFTGSRTMPSGQTESGIFVGDVVVDPVSGLPVAVINVRLVVTSSSTPSEAVWMSDSKRIAFIYMFAWDTRQLCVASVQPAQFDSNGQLIETPVAGTPVTMTGLPAPVSGYDTGQPENIIASPVLGDDRLAFKAAYTATGYSITRYDVYSVTIPAGYDGLTSLAARRLTGTAFTLDGNSTIQWSSEAALLAYNYGLGFYQFASVGASKPTPIYTFKGKYALWGTWQWRP